MAAVFVGITAVVGLIIFLICAAAGLSGHAENVMQQLYFSLVAGHAVLGLIVFAVALGAAAVGDEIRKAHRAAYEQRQTIIAVLRTISERSTRSAGGDTIPILSPGPQAAAGAPPPIGEYRSPTGPGGWPRDPSFGR